MFRESVLFWCKGSKCFHPNLSKMNGVVIPIHFSGVGIGQIPGRSQYAHLTFSNNAIMIHLHYLHSTDSCREVMNSSGGILFYRKRYKKVMKSCKQSLVDKSH